MQTEIRTDDGQRTGIRDEMLGILDTRISDAGPQQLVKLRRTVILNGVVIGDDEVHEWKPIVGGKAARKRRSTRFEFWKSIDWTKSNDQISRETGRSYCCVSNNRSKFANGIAGARRLNDSKYAELMPTLDWTKQDCVLAREHGINAGSVRTWRKKLGKPRPATARIMSKAKVVSEDMIEAADWVNDNDMELSKKWKVSRERVRQIRELRRKPACRFFHRRSDYKAMFLWLESNHDSITGKNALDVARMIPPGDIDVSYCYKVMKATGIAFEWGTNWLTSTNHHSAKMDWRLGNKILSLIWCKHSQTVAGLRYRHNLPKPQWQMLGRSWITEECVAAIKANIEVAKALGFDGERAALAHLDQWKDRIASEQKPRPACANKGGTMRVNKRVEDVVLKQTGGFDYREIFAQVNTADQIPLSPHTVQVTIYLMKKDGRIVMTRNKCGKKPAKYRLATMPPSS